MRTVYWFFCFAMTLITTLPALYKAKRLGKQGKLEQQEAFVHRASSKWMKGNIRRSGSTVEVIGTENVPANEAVVFISNHQGDFDIPILMSAIDHPKGFISKAEVQKIPIIVSWMKLLHCVFMDRSTLKASAQALIEGVKTVKAGHSLVIFPEGTRSKGDQMGPFKSASFKLATKAGVPIVPVTIDGSYKILEEHRRIIPSHVKVTIHPAIPTKDLDKEALSKLPEQVKTIIQSALPYPSN